VPPVPPARSPVPETPRLLFRIARVEERLRPQLLTALLGVGALACLVLTPPFQTPDAGSHFLRAWQLARGQLFAEKRAAATGGELPRAAIADATRFSDLPFHAERKLSRTEFRARLEASAPLTDESLRTLDFAGFSNTALYSPVPYLPQAAAIALAARLHLRDLAAFYLASLAALFASLLCFFLAFRALASSLRAAALAFVTGGLPMSLFLLGSLNPDGLTLSLCVLNAALALRLRARFERRQFLFFLFTAALISACKTLYFFAPLAALALLCADINWISRTGLSRISMVLLATLMPTLCWSLCTQHLFSPIVPGVAPLAQLDYTLHHLGEVLAGFATTLYSSRRDLWIMLVGQLGWLDTRLSRATINTATALLFAAAMLRTSPPSSPWSARDLLFRWSTFASFLIALCLSCYLAWSPVGGALDGLQGRYFLPFLFILLESLPPLLPAPGRWGQSALLGIAIAWSTVAIRTAATLAQRYWS